MSQCSRISSPSRLNESWSSGCSRTTSNSESIRWWSWATNSKGFSENEPSRDSSGSELLADGGREMRTGVSSSRAAGHVPESRSSWVQSGCLVT